MVWILFRRRQAHVGRILSKKGFPVRKRGHMATVCRDSLPLGSTGELVSEKPSGSFWPRSARDQSLVRSHQWPDNYRNAWKRRSARERRFQLLSALPDEFSEFSAGPKLNYAALPRIGKRSRPLSLRCAALPNNRTGRMGYRMFSRDWERRGCTEFERCNLLILYFRFLIGSDLYGNYSYYY